MQKVITLTKHGPEITSDRGAFDELRDLYNSQSFVYLPNLIAPDLLERLARNVENCDFKPITYGVGRELSASDPKTDALISLLLNNTELFDFVQMITNCGPIGSFFGRPYRYLPGEEHFDNWHDDLIQHRLVALSINLGKEPYEGGVLELRDKTLKIVETIPNPGFGDAILFRIAGHLEHRRTAVHGEIPKTAIAGWFRSEPKFLDLVHASKRS